MTLSTIHLPMPPIPNGRFFMKQSTTSLNIAVKSLSSFVAAVLLALPASVSAAKPKGSVTNPDFTKGESIPEGFKHDWNLGATGARGWMFPDKLVTTDARQIKITKVAQGSPADGTLAVGDVIPVSRCGRT